MGTLKELCIAAYLGATTMGKGSNFASSHLRGWFYFVWFRGRYACGRPVIFLTA